MWNSKRQKFEWGIKKFNWKFLLELRNWLFPIPHGNNNNFPYNQQISANILILLLKLPQNWVFFQLNFLSFLPLHPHNCHFSQPAERKKREQVRYSTLINYRKFNKIRFNGEKKRNACDGKDNIPSTLLHQVWQEGEEKKKNLTKKKNLLQSFPFRVIAFNVNFLPHCNLRTFIVYLLNEKKGWFNKIFFMLWDYIFRCWKMSIN